MASSATLTSGVAGRYATALFEIAKDCKLLDEVERDIRDLETAHADERRLPRDARLARLIPARSRARRSPRSPPPMGLGTTVTNTLGLMAQNRRLFVVPGLIAQVKALIAAERGEVTAEVTSAKPLTKAQTEELAATLKKSVGKDVKIAATVDESLIGGLVVKVGSRMIDTSIRAKLANLQNMMKEVG